MKLEKEFAVSRPKSDVVGALADDDVLAKIFPGTRVEHRAGGVRETFTPFKALGQSREIHFFWMTLPDGSLRFEKECNGNVWRSLEGKIAVDEVDDSMTSVRLTMEGSTRAFVPELTIRQPLREQIEDMAKSLRRELEHS